MMSICCAAPVVVGLRRARAPAGAAVVFWLGNTPLNPATMIFIGFVLGWCWAGLKLVLGVIAVLGFGWLANGLATPDEAMAATRALAPMPDRLDGGSFRRWLTILVRLALWLLPEYLVLALGAAHAWLFPHAGPEVGNGLGWITTFAIAGTAFVIATAGEVPIIQTMLSQGVGVGPPGALLMVLPLISVPSLVAVWRALPPRLLAAQMVGTMAVGVLGAWRWFSILTRPARRSGIKPPPELPDSRPAIEAQSTPSITPDSRRAGW